MNQKAIQSTESPVMHILKQKVPESDSDTNALLQRHSMKEQNFLQTGQEYLRKRFHGCGSLTTYQPLKYALS